MRTPGRGRRPRLGSHRPSILRLAAVAWSMLAACAPVPEAADVVLLGGTVHDGTGGAAFLADVAVTRDRIAFVGDAAREGLEAADTVDASGLIVVPGFIDMHSHAVLGRDYARSALPFLHQGITTVVDGADGGGDPEIAERLQGYAEEGIGANAVEYVGHGAVRRRVMGMEDRAPSADELERMKELVRDAMEEGAFGLSTGLFYTPGFYAETEEVIELARVAAEYGGLYDTHGPGPGRQLRGRGIPGLDPGGHPDR